VNECQSVLIVDDEVLITKVLSYYLSAKGYDVNSVNSPERALSMADCKRFDVVISDVRMVPVSGIEFVARLRRSNFGGKIIMISSCFREVEQQLRELKVDALLEKPFDLSSLLEVLRA
jgi:DNA-binding response OmpR family regulator